MEPVFNEIFTHTLDSDVAELVTLSDFLHLKQQHNPFANTTEFTKLMLTLETVIKTSTFFVRISNIEEKHSQILIEEERRKLAESRLKDLDSDSDQSESELSDLSPGLCRGLYDCEDKIDPALLERPKSQESRGTSTTESVFKKDHLGQTIQQRIDRIFTDFFVNSSTTSLIASSIREKFHVVDYVKRGSYVLYFNPLDSIYNVYCGTSCGTFFSFIKKEDYQFKEGFADDHILLPGSSIDCAGYVIYGSSTSLVLGIRQGGVHQFTLDSNLGLFILTSKDIKTPPKGSTYTIPESSSSRWNKVVSTYISEKKMEGEEFNYYQPGSVVSSLHYILHEGGIMIDPTMDMYEEGETPLLFNANPMAFLMKESDGACYNGAGLEDILRISPQQLHQTTPIFLGSRNDVDELKDVFHKFSQDIY